LKKVSAKAILVVHRIVESGNSIFNYEYLPELEVKHSKVSAVQVTLAEQFLLKKSKIHLV
jgi:hypothetical protein